MDSGDDDERLVHDFRKLVSSRLGKIGVAVLDLRLAGGETQSLAGSPAVGGRGRDTIKRAVQQIKALAREYAASLDAPNLLRRIEKAMTGEEAAVAKRLATTALRQAVGV